MDKEVRLQLLRAAVRDRMFLKSASKEMRPDDFQETAEQVIAEAALTFYDRYEEPIGGMLRDWTTQIVATRRPKLSSDSLEKLKVLLGTILGAKMEPTSPKALEDRVHTLRRHRFFDDAVEEVVSHHEKGELNAQVLETLVDRAQRELSFGDIRTSDYLSEEDLQRRVARRMNEVDDEKFPLLMIDPLDEYIRAIGKQMFGIVVAPPSSGKSFFLQWLGVAYAMQSFRGLYITLEDPKALVEDRLDAALTGLPIAKLAALPNRLRKRFRSMMESIHGRIEIYDGTSEEMSCARIEKIIQCIKADKNVDLDFLVLDYDEEMHCPGMKFTGELARKREFEEIYRQFRRVCVRNNLIGWTAAQTNVNCEGKKVITMKDIGEDKSKAKRAFLAISIGTDPEDAKVKHLYVMRHRMDASRFGVDVVTDFEHGMMFDKEATYILRRNRRLAATGGDTDGA